MHTQTQARDSPPGCRALPDQVFPTLLPDRAPANRRCAPLPRKAETQLLLQRHSREKSTAGRPLSDGGGNNIVPDKTVCGRWCCPPLLFGISFRRLTSSFALHYYAILVVYMIQCIIYFETYVYGGSIFTFYSPAHQTASVC